jgi:hypothetical protein
MRLEIQRCLKQYMKFSVNSNIFLYIKEENIIPYLVRHDEWKSYFLVTK